MHHQLNNAAINGRFKVSKAMSIVGIGYILAGHIIEGRVEAGNIIRLNHLDNLVAYVVDAVETIEYGETNSRETALILEPVLNGFSAEKFYALEGHKLDVSNRV
ncbi:hypothetical protein HH214_00900 [Mucilaginibacter robiniae]|uniref:Translation elongation factor EFTu-like domain-containing protein n=1 Tax=Mucilaginibacter robiniae TaxID=2728022 RepID=A0A7L5DX06_9SPHI|nr:hypothetical protein [Mucilaginibacter robiniae]QJD94529.1 hypothetical protein HH214_00900 [Mucilaginibacter robiniae]